MASNSSELKNTTHSLQLKEVKSAIGRIVELLNNYSLLANAHATDFVVKDFWKTLLPGNIQQQLSSLSETELKCLSTVFLQEPQNCESSSKCSYTSAIKRNEPASSISSDDKRPSNEINFEKEPTVTMVKENRSWKNSDSTDKINVCNRKEAYQALDESYINCQNLKRPIMEWKHSNVKDFCIEATECTIEHLGLARPYEDVIQGRGNGKPFIGTFMNDKKSHEIERMAAVCNCLVHEMDTDLVIDFGSGKGYLGSYLSLQYNVPVLGIDAVSIHTESAARRTSILTKQWNGLTKHKEREINHVSLTKKEKKLLKRKGSSVETPTDVVKETGYKGQVKVKPNTGRYVPVTMFIENFTDLNKLVNDNFPELSKMKTVKSPSLHKRFLDSIQDSDNVSINSTVLYYKDDVQMKCDSNSIDLSIEIQQLSVKDKPDLLSRNACHSNIKCTDSDNKLRIDSELDASGNDIKHDTDCKSDIDNSGKLETNCRLVSRNIRDIDYKPKDDNIRKSITFQPVHRRKPDPYCKPDADYKPGSDSIGKPDYKPVTIHTPDIDHKPVTKSKADFDREPVTDVRNGNPEHVEKDSDTDMKTILTGLHTCGNLASTSLELFVHSPILTTLCNVGCCYHRLTEEFQCTGEQVEGCRSSDNSAGFPMSSILKEKGFSLGRSARKLACLSVPRLEQTELQGRKLFPRALLEVLFHRLDVKDSDREGKSLRGLERKCNTSHEFLTRACEKLDIMHKVDDKVIRAIIEEFGDDEEKLAAFFQLRTLLAPSIESLIILDRACYLLEQDTVAEVFIVRMFDPIISPRCYGIIATKTS